MKGLELSRTYFEAYGSPMLHEQFSALLPYLAVGLFGPGSECFGYDDSVSWDHDFEPGFCILLPGEDVIDRRNAFRLERAYAKLPKEFGGFRREALSPVGGARRGVLRTADVFEALVGAADGKLSMEQWLTVPEQGLAEATNGCLFYDRYGEVSEIRSRLRRFPQDIRLKRLAGNLLLMGQSGQYNYSRCLAHGEPAAAQLAVFAFVDSAMSAIFLLNRVYQPYYKWRFRAFRSLPILGGLSDNLDMLMHTANDADSAKQKQIIMEDICSQVIQRLQEDGLRTGSSADLELHAYAVNDQIKDSAIRNLHILAAV